MRRIVIRGNAARRIRRFDNAVDAVFEENLRGRQPWDRLFYGASALGDHGMIWVMLGALRGLRGGDHNW